MHVKWLRAALRDLDEIATYIAEDDPHAAEHTVATVVGATELLTTHPMMGRAGRVFGTRELIVSGTPYIVAYRARDVFLEILAVIHGAREWPKPF